MMATCRVCESQYEFDEADDDIGYSRDLCGPFCAGMAVGLKGFGAKEQALTDEEKHLKDTILTAGFLLADEKAEVARLREALGGVKSLCVALFDGADRCSQAPYYIVQPFLGIVKDHAAIIEEHQLLNSTGAADKT